MCKAAPEGLQCQGSKRLICGKHKSRLCSWHFLCPPRIHMSQWLHLETPLQGPNAGFGKASATSEPHWFYRGSFSECAKRAQTEIRSVYLLRVSLSFLRNLILHAGIHVGRFRIDLLLWWLGATCCCSRNHPAWGCSASWNRQDTFKLLI